MAFTLSSTSFSDGASIPRRYTGDGENVSPPLAWQDPPEGALSFVLIVEDPDASRGTFRHWGVYDIAGDARRLDEGATGSFMSAVNDYGDRAYHGPRPPSGSGPHHYHFRLAALDTAQLRVFPTARIEDLWVAAQPHMLGETALIGIYER